ncbi:MAG: TIGR02444 family protein [Pseudohongiellaceae bacterium]|nr:TIGR02444 family protein [Pseudohongiellaceae bacterium]
MENFWDYSVRVYATHDVSNHCLQLQDSFGFDVNLILFCCWHASTRAELDPVVLHRACELSAIWSKELVKPMRRARRWMKAPASQLVLPPSEQIQEQWQQLRQQIKKVELQAEMLQENMLESLVSSQGRDISLEEASYCCIQNWKKLAIWCAISITEELAEVLKKLLLSVIPDTPVQQSTIKELLIAPLQ